MLLRPTVLEIDLDEIRRNLRLFDENTGNAALTAVVKADCYGHGAVPCAKAALEAGAKVLCVALIEEGIELREAGIAAPILMLGYADENALEYAVKYDIMPMIFTAENLLACERAAQKVGKCAKIHIKIDTGMNRIGLKTQNELRELLETAKSCPHVEICGVMTHFCTADVPESDFGIEQMEVFRRLLPVFDEYGVKPFVHAAASAAALRFENARFDGVRAGIVMYGVDYTGKLPVRPAMTWKTKISHIKVIHTGETVGYGRHFAAEQDTVIATLPVGYADGYRRAFTNKANVLIGGQRARVTGNVCMDQIMVNVTGIPCKVGDEAVLLGVQGEERISPVELADIADTIPYEITTGISKRVPRVYLHE